MKDKIEVPEHLPVLREEDKVAAAKRRENYAIQRDLQAKEFNEAIITRLVKERDKQ